MKEFKIELNATDLRKLADVYEMSATEILESTEWSLHGMIAELIDFAYTENVKLT